MTAPAAPERDAAAQTAWARALMGELGAAGVELVVVSPGSRSTPFVLAADAVGLAWVTILDERAAGFFALGRAKATGRPVALVCTSGTAGAHYYPAVIEAAATFTPLIAITADRPPELSDCGAPQTIDQRFLFGAHVRWYVDLGVPEPRPAAVQALRRKAAQAVRASLGPTPGPVHINAPARKPLEPVEVDAPALPPASAPPPAPIEPIAAEADIDALAERCRLAERGLIVAGPAHIAQSAAREAVFALAAATGFPLAAEAASQLRFAGTRVPRELFDAAALVTASPRARAALAPDLVIQLGAAPTASGMQALLAENPAAELWAVAPHGWPDPTSRARVVRGAVADTAARLTRRTRRPRSPRHAAWSRTLAIACARAWQAVDEELAAAPAGGLLHEGQAVRTAAAALPPESLLALGNSLPVRSADLYCPGRLCRVDVWSQRGASGIDGLIAGAAGAAAARRSPTLLILGDVSFAHDIGGLHAAVAAAAPLVIAVIDNGGGRIFDQLPAASAVDPDLFRRLFTTPPALDPAGVAAAFDLPYTRAHTGPELAAATAAALERRGCAIVHAIVDPNSAAAAAKRLRTTIERDVDRILAEGGTT